MEVLQQGRVQDPVALRVRHHERRGRCVGQVDQDPALPRVDLEDAQRVGQSGDVRARPGGLDAREEPLAQGPPRPLLPRDGGAAEVRGETALQGQVERQETQPVRGLPAHRPALDVQPCGRHRPRRRGTVPLGGLLEPQRLQARQPRGDALQEHTARNAVLRREALGDGVRQLVERLLLVVRTPPGLQDRRVVAGAAVRGEEEGAEILVAGRQMRVPQRLFEVVAVLDGVEGRIGPGGQPGAQQGAGAAVVHPGAAQRAEETADALRRQQGQPRGDQTALASALLRGGPCWSRPGNGGTNCESVLQRHGPEVAPESRGRPRDGSTEPAMDSNNFRTCGHADVRMRDTRTHRRTNTWTCADVRTHGGPRPEERGGARIRRQTPGGTRDGRPEPRVRA
ncbi:hypothetical protein GCM10009564_42720 [Streptomyces thermogriseus]|uniref:Uncharacterized protein n=1 Tax=Streptomyces thermogriseus TaxID=75292 RepID=A0ABP4DQM3_9ACTN